MALAVPYSGGAARAFYVSFVP